MMKTATITPASTTSPKALVMLDATGKMATLKLTTSTGLHVYDGSMLWVNPAQTVTAAAPQSSQTAPQVPPHKSTKALAIVHPETGEEIVVKKPDPPAPAVAPASATAEATPGSTPAPAPVVQTEATPTAPSTSSPPQKEQNIIDLLAKATNSTPSALLAMSQPLLSSAMPPVQGRGRGRGRDYDEDDHDRAKGRGGKGPTKVAPADVKGKGKGPKGADAKRVEVGQYLGERYTKDAKYTASLDGRFWSLSTWPTGERDEEHKLTFGKHKLEVVENGLVKVVLYGGVNRYKIRLHLATEGDPTGIEDKEGWGVATCEPSAANLQLSEDAELLGWKIYKGGEHPVLYPPGVPLPDSDPVEGADPSKAETKEEPKPEAKETKTEVKEEVKAKEETKPEDVPKAEATKEVTQV